MTNPKCIGKWKHIASKKIKTVLTDKQIFWMAYTFLAYNIKDAQIYTPVCRCCNKIFCLCAVVEYFRKALNKCEY